jgi:CHAT domain-containing protein
MTKDILISDGKSKIYKASEDPMMRSGLLLAGAKNYWGKSNPNNTIENGILTASEISNLDFSACQLVVLSACETGLGEVKGSEGVFGLQRAFKMAGVKNIIMSLWKVPDSQTAELFDIFYSECFVGKSIHEAFQSAQTKMKAKYSPYYWAGFVLLE